VTENHIPNIALGRRRKLDLHAVYAVDAVKEQDQNEDERDLRLSASGLSAVTGERTFSPYCNFAMIGLSDRNVKSLRFHVKGIGTMRATKTNISKTRSMNT